MFHVKWSNDVTISHHRTIRMREPSFRECWPDGERICRASSGGIRWPWSGMFSWPPTMARCRALRCTCTIIQIRSPSIVPTTRPWIVWWASARSSWAFPTPCRPPSRAGSSHHASIEAGSCCRPSTLDPPVHSLCDIRVPRKESWTWTRIASTWMCIRRR